MSFSRRPQAQRASIACLFLLMLLISRSTSAGSLTLAWDPTPDPSVIGYVVYVGTTSGLYTESVDVGPATTFSMTNAVDGCTYYFAVASYAKGPLVGPPSAEVSGATNGGPTLVSPGDQESQVGQAVTLPLK